MIEHPELFIGLGAFGVVVGVGLLLLVARRARRARRLRISAATSGRGGRVYGTPRRDPAETSVMPRRPWGGDGRG